MAARELGAWVENPIRVRRAILGSEIRWGRVAAVLQLVAETDVRY